MATARKRAHLARLSTGADDCYLPCPRIAPFPVLASLVRGLYNDGDSPQPNGCLLIARNCELASLGLILTTSSLRIRITATLTQNGDV